MKAVFRIAISLFLVLNILISITGISVLEHLCDCHPAVRLTLLPGLIYSQSECCCADHANSSNHVQHQTACHVNSKNHCKDVRIFLRKEILANDRQVRSDEFQIKYFDLNITFAPFRHELYIEDISCDAIVIRPPPEVSLLILYHSLRYSPSEPPLC